MTGKIISFKQAKKHAGYAKKEIKAAENRKKFGSSKAEKVVDEFEVAKQKKRLDDRNLTDD